MKKYIGAGAVEMGIAVLMIIVISSILVFKYAPAGSASSKRNEQRREDIQKIINGIIQYKNEYSGNLPVGLPRGENCELKEYEMCSSNAAVCEGYVYIQDFTNSTRYLDSIPVDPKSESINGTGYNIVVNDSGLVTVCAPLSEKGEKISIKSE